AAAIGDSSKAMTEKFSADSVNTLRQTAKVEAIVEVPIDKVNEKPNFKDADSLKNDKKENVVMNDSVVETNTEQAANPFYKKADSLAQQKNISAKENNGSVAIVPATEEKSPARNCSKMLSDNDIEKLRKKIFTTSGDDKMIEVANKFFNG